jgi:hypothetical protein
MIMAEPLSFTRKSAAWLFFFDKIAQIRRSEHFEGLNLRKTVIQGLAQFKINGLDDWAWKLIDEDWRGLH